MGVVVDQHAQRDITTAPDERMDGGGLRLGVEPACLRRCRLLRGLRLGRRRRGRRGLRPDGRQLRLGRTALRRRVSERGARTWSASARSTSIESPAPSPVLVAGAVEVVEVVEVVGAVGTVATPLGDGWAAEEVVAPAGAPCHAAPTISAAAAKQAHPIVRGEADVIRTRLSIGLSGTQLDVSCAETPSQFSRSPDCGASPLGRADY
ncbi:MAG: hypothetical protein V9G12_25245 [Microthrixaceae bacterium]